MENLILVTEWDKTFPKSDKVDHSKVTFINRYGITLAADMYVPKESASKLPAIAVSGPFGAVKEQCSGLYAQTMAERGFSGGSRGMALNAAALDTRIKATVTSTMYDMARVNANGYFDSEDSEEARYEKKKALNELRTKEFAAGEYSLGGGCMELPVPDDMPFFVKDYSDYYKRMDRGYHSRSLNSNGGWNSIGCMSFMNQPILKYSNEIRSAVLMIHGEKAHSCYFSKDAFADIIKDSKYTTNKELMIIPGAVRTDLYDGGGKDVIPFDKMVSFFTDYLK